MILYHLQCESGHQFEAWFRDIGTFDSQCVNGHVECPFCGDFHVNEAPSMVSDANNEPAPQAPGVAQDIAEQILHAVEKLRGHVTDPTDDHGDDFPRKTRRVDYGDADGHGHFGDAAEEIAEELDEEPGGYHRLRSASRQDD